MPDVLPAVAVTDLGGDSACPDPIANLPARSVAIVVPVWDRWDGCTRSAQGLAARLTHLGAAATIFCVNPPRNPGAEWLANASGRRFDLCVATMDTIARCVDFRIGAKLAVWIHGPSTWSWTRGFESKIDLWLVPSLAFPMADACPGWPPSPGKILEMQPGFDPSAWTSAGPEGRDGLLAVDASPGKGGAVLKAIARANPAIQMTVVCGGGPSPEMGLGDLPNVRVIGQRDDMGPLYRRAAALIHPSPSETWGLVVAEAQACGCPVVCADTPVLRMTSGVTGSSAAPSILLPTERVFDRLWIDIARVLSAPGTPLWMDLHRLGLDSAARWRDDSCFKKLLEETRG